MSRKKHNTQPCYGLGVEALVEIWIDRQRAQSAAGHHAAAGQTGKMRRELQEAANLVIPPEEALSNEIPPEKTNQGKTMTCPHCGKIIDDTQSSARCAQALGRLARGVPKKYSPAEIAKRTARLAEAGKKRWPKK